MTQSTTTSPAAPPRGPSLTGDASGGSTNPLAGMPPYDPVTDPTGDQYAADGLRRKREATPEEALRFAVPITSLEEDPDGTAAAAATLAKLPNRPQ